MRTAANTSDWKDGFLFVGNEFVLDFVNTHPVQDGESMELLKDFAAVLRWFRAAGLISPAEAYGFRRQWDGTVRAQKVTQAMRALRENLRNEILAWEQGGAIRRSTIEELNRLMADHPMRTRIVANESARSTESWFELDEPEDLFAPLAQSAATLFTNVNRKRVRRCARCVLHFHDTSKKGTRRWCSMRLCGNRLKVAAYAARRRRHAHKV